MFYRGGEASTLEEECKQSLTAEFCTSLFSAPQRTLQKSEATLFFVPIFKSAIVERESTIDAVARLRQDRYFLKFGGSDFLFACYSKNCKSRKRDLLYVLGKQNRAFWLARNGTAKWTCTDRIVGIEDVPPSETAKALRLSRALKKAGERIQGRNRWRCQGRTEWGLTSVPLFGFDVIQDTSFYSEKDKVAYCGVPKVGSSVAVLMMRRMNGMSDWKQSNTVQIRNFHTGYNWTYLNRKHAFRLFDDTNWVKGMLVRDPITRLLSGYRSKIEDLKDYSKLPGHWKGDEPPTFEQTVQRIKEAKDGGSFDKMDRHFRPQSALCGVRHLPYDFIGRYEERADDVKGFLKSVDLWQSIGATGWGVNGTTAIYAQDEQIIRGKKPKPVTHADDKSIIQQYYTEDLIKLVMELYDEDYQRFGFSKDIDAYL